MAEEMGFSHQPALGHAGHPYGPPQREHWGHGGHRRWLQTAALSCTAIHLSTFNKLSSLKIIITNKQIYQPVYISIKLSSYMHLLYLI